jgi:hypothetical protein
LNNQASRFSTFDCSIDTISSRPVVVIVVRESRVPDSSLRDQRGARVEDQHSVPSSEVEVSITHRRVLPAPPRFFLHSFDPRLFRGVWASQRPPQRLTYSGSFILLDFPTPHASTPILHCSSTSLHSISHRCLRNRHHVPSTLSRCQRPIVRPPFTNGQTHPARPRAVRPQPDRSEDEDARP